MYGTNETFGRGIGDLASPPRSVPLGVRLRVLCGGFSSQFGWIFLGFGLAISLLLLPAIDWSPITFRGEIVEGKGVITKVEKTSHSEGGSKNSPGTPIYAISFSYTGSGGVTGEGVSYVKGDQVNKGQRVRVEYLRDKPHMAKIRGMRMGPQPMFALFVLAFPIIGLCFVLVGIKKGLRGISLLANGLQGQGKLIGKARTNTRVNNQTVFKLIFEFQAQDGQTYKAFAKTHKTAKLQDEELEPLLYDPFDPNRAVMLDALPGGPRIDETGSIRAGAFGGGLAVLFIPAAAIVANALVVYFNYMR